MPRVSREEMERNREKIIGSSVKLFKISGFAGASVNDIMAAAGLTHGGFYGHFESKDELAAIASAKAFDESAERWGSIANHATTERTFLTSLFDYYLSDKQLDDVGGGCPAVALATDTSREAENKSVRQVYTKGVKTMLSFLQTFTQSRRNHKTKEKALVQIAAMVGAVTLARATSDDELSGEILDAVKKHLTAQSTN